MKREIITTQDGSTSIHLPDWNENYHSKHGAIQEAQHVFIKNGLSLFPRQPVSILEMGFGTGLNALITILESEKLQQQICYVGLEAYPVSPTEVLAMNYVSELNDPTIGDVFEQMHQCSWNEQVLLKKHFTFTKKQQFFNEIDDSNLYDLIYFDAFGYRVQPECWSTEIFIKMHKALRPAGILVTYAARGVVKRSMIEAGFAVEKLEGPPGKREMFRATKMLES